MLLLIATLLWRAPSRSWATRLGALFALTVVATTIASAPGFAAAAQQWRVLVAAFATGSMFVFWLFTRALFDDRFALRGWHGAVWVALAAAGIAVCAASDVPAPAPWVSLLALALGILPVGWALLSIAQSAASWREDLVERRRELRTLIVAATASYAVAQLLVAVLWGLTLRALFESTANAAGIAALTMLVAWRLLRSRDDAFFAAALPPAPPPQDPRAEATELASDPPLVRPVPELTPADAKHLQTLATLMSVDHLYREPSLSVGSLAERMNLPEHKLRRLINQGLGHRNFSAFLNSHRLADAKRWLADPAQGDAAILTIAMDAGFPSIGPFNRAFKADTGLTPSEYRRRSAQPTSPEHPADLAESEIG